MKKIITTALFLILATTMWSQTSENIQESVDKINTLFKENALNTKFYEKLQVVDGNLIFKNIGFT